MNRLKAFSEHYLLALNNFLHSNDEVAEDASVALTIYATQELDLLNILAIHYDCLFSILQCLDAEHHVEINKKSGIFLRSNLNKFKVNELYAETAIALFDKRASEFAARLMSLQRSLKEKEVLLKEIYHRVKNNLQIISSLTNLQIDATADSNAKQVLTENAARIKSMALLHELLYQSENLAEINMQQYVNHLVDYLSCMYSFEPNHTALYLQIDPVILNIDTAIPCGLIINELISNTIKHTFSKTNDTRISIILKDHGFKKSLTVSDNGKINLKQFETYESLGFKLIKGLTKQLNGEIEFQTDHGFAVTINFPS